MAPIELTAEIEKKARIFGLIGDGTRIRIFRLLMKKKRVNVSDIAKEVGMGIACVSHHLQLLKDNHLLKSKREGNNIFYELADDKFVKNLISLI